MLARGRVIPIHATVPRLWEAGEPSLRSFLIGLAHGASRSSSDHRPLGRLYRVQRMAEYRVPAMASRARPLQAAACGLRTAEKRHRACACRRYGFSSRYRRLAQAMSDMRFLFDEDLERFVGSINDALLKKHALDALLEKAGGRDDAATDHDLIETARGISRELASQITNGIYLDVPEHMEKFMRREPCHRHVTQRRRRHRNRVLMRVPSFQGVLNQAYRVTGIFSGLRGFCKTASRRPAQ